MLKDYGIEKKKAVERRNLQKSFEMCCHMILDRLVAKQQVR